MGEKIDTIQASTESGTYNILIGSSSFEDISIHEFLNRYDKTACIVSRRVLSLHGDYIQKNLSRVNQNQIYEMDDREENKNYHYAGEFLERLINDGFTRKSAVIGIGGGVVGDFAGFVSSLYMRGIPVVHVPTTLLAMVDSSIGGKVAVNLSRGKNMAGSFHQPSLVINDISFLKTLPDKELLNGVIEALKHGLIGDIDTLLMLEQHEDSSFIEEWFLTKVVTRSVLFKTSIVEQDERESGLREILNFGHTIAHGIESYHGYRNVTHGEAVAEGIVIESDISRRVGLLSDSEYDRIKKFVEKFGLAGNLITMKPKELIAHLMLDKKNFGETIRFTLLNGIGNPSIKQAVNESILLDVLWAHFRDSDSGICTC